MINPLFKVLVTDISGTYRRGYTDDPKKWVKADKAEGWYQEGQPWYVVSFKVIKA